MKSRECSRLFISGFAGKAGSHSPRTCRFRCRLQLDRNNVGARLAGEFISGSIAANIHAYRFGQRNVVQAIVFIVPHFRTRIRTERRSKTGNRVAVSDDQYRFTGVSNLLGEFDGRFVIVDFNGNTQPRSQWGSRAARAKRVGAEDARDTPLRQQSRKRPGARLAGFAQGGIVTREFFGMPHYIDVCRFDRRYRAGGGEHQQAGEKYRKDSRV